MNYFGFRKIAGKGKMAPCSYVNECATEDISSLLFIKRKKTAISSAAAKLMAQQNQLSRSLGCFGDVGMTGTSSGMMCYSSGLGDPSLGGISTTFSLNDQSCFLLEQQSMIAQLQQAHLTSLNNSVVQATQNKKIPGLNIAAGGENTGLLTTDQGNVFIGSNNIPNSRGIFITSDAATAQSLLRHDASSCLDGGGMISQTGIKVSGEGSNNLDSAANLRALINQQISMFNTPRGTFSRSAMNAFGAPPGNQLPPAGVTQGHASSCVPSPNRNESLNRGLIYGWNDLLQLSVGLGGSNDANKPGNNHDNVPFTSHAGHQRF